MNTISSTFDEKLCSCTVLGSSDVLENAKFPVSVLILNRNSGTFKEHNFENLLKCGFESIISMESPKENFKIDSYLKRFPQIQYVVPSKEISVGELINLGFSICYSRYLLVIWDDFVIKPGFFTENVMNKILEQQALCFAPALLNSEFQNIYVKMSPKIERFNFSIAADSLYYDNSNTLFPFDFAGVYDKSKFISVGGFDYSITSPYWQLLDFSLRSWLWGEKIIASTSYKFYYQGQEPVADVTIDDSYFRFFLKNIAINKKIDYAYLPVRTFITFHRNSNYSFGPALSEFRNVRRWVYQNKYRYKTEIKKLTETWDEDVQ